MKKYKFSKWHLLILLILAYLLIVPFIHTRTTMSMINRIFIFASFAMAYDILRGYTGFIHLGFALYFGGGAYSVAILFNQFGSTYQSLLLAIIFTIIYSTIWSLITGKIAARSNVLSTAMITMAFSEILRNIMERWRSISNGADGLKYNLPEMLTNRQIFFYISLAFIIVVYLILRRFTNSPTGRVLQSIRENEQRAVFLGYNTAKARTIALIVAGNIAGLAGIMYALLNRFVNTDVLALQTTYNAMLYSLIGGTGTIYGSIVGTSVVIYFQDLLLNLRQVHPIFERWLLFFGALYIIIIMFMPEGIVGFINNRIEKTKKRKIKKVRGTSNV